MQSPHLSWVDVIFGSTPPCSIGSSISTLASGEGGLCPSHSSPPIFCCFANFTASHDAWALASSSFFLCFSASYDIQSFVSSFLHYAANLSVSTAEPTGGRHSGNQDSRTAKIKSSVARYGMSCHVFAGSFCTLIKTWWKSALNSANLCKLAYTVGDNHGL